MLEACHEEEEGWEEQEREKRLFIDRLEHSDKEASKLITQSHADALKRMHYDANWGRRHDHEYSTLSVLSAPPFV